MLLVRGDGQGPVGVDGYATIVTRVEQLRGLEFKTTPRLELVEARRLRARMVAATREDQRRAPAEFRATDLLPTLAGVATREEYVRWIQESYDVLGLFDFTRPGEILVLDDPVAMDEIESEAVIAHELTHALEYQHFASARERAFDDRGWVTSALAEGSAMLVEAMYRRKHLGDRAPLEVLLRLLTEAVPTELPPGLQLLSAFPYETGTEFVHALHERDGWDGVNGAHRRPPGSSGAIFGDDPGTGRAPPLPRADALGEGWRRLSQVDLGPLATRSLVAHDPDAGDMADGVRSAASVVFQRGSGDCRLPCADSTAAVLTWQTATEGDARELAHGLRRLEAAAPARVVADGTNVRMAIAPQAALAGRLATSTPSK